MLITTEFYLPVYRMVNIRTFIIVALFICAANAAVLLPVLEDEELEKGLPAFRLDSDDADDVLMEVLPELGDVTSKFHKLHSKRGAGLFNNRNKLTIENIYE